MHPHPRVGPHSTIVRVDELTTSRKPPFSHPLFCLTARLLVHVPAGGCGELVCAGVVHDHRDARVDPHHRQVVVPTVALNASTNRQAPQAFNFVCLGGGQVDFEPFGSPPARPPARTHFPMVARRLQYVWRNPTESKLNPKSTRGQFRVAPLHTYSTSDSVPWQPGPAVLPALALTRIPRLRRRTAGNMARRR